jgi:hypothetical protein
MLFSRKIIKVDSQKANSPPPPSLPSHKNKPQHTALLNPVYRKLTKIEKTFYKTSGFHLYSI